jgi:Phospholipase_D-nuclease N-terminal
MRRHFLRVFECTAIGEAGGDSGRGWDRHGTPEPVSKDSMLTAGSFSLGNFLLDVLAISVRWFWLLITMIGDMFRHHDISGLAKAIWVIVLILLPYLGYSST